MGKNNTPRLFVVAAPSGAGKTSLVKELLKKHPSLRMSVSYTTRPKRSNEVHGEHYWFVSVNEINDLKGSEDLLEHAQVLIAGL